ncbi:hypothetical protein SAMN05421869_14827 [Nonomuraea jiangxiensis]|uniref:Uncharacterized protein n=1 Tax=Nonomuraea jiangxiensis TaxID=633440 RepID=A0A1G9UEM8_9ACTN|nr:hypothetical protein [Nonomuraea jiangxiensis]SDM58400.1 hypothetical protein SAMN05421869_14827 [Nonomuraea jiangxiensis]
MSTTYGVSITAIGVSAKVSAPNTRSTARRAGDAPTARSPSATAAHVERCRPAGTAGTCRIARTSAADNANVTASAANDTQYVCMTATSTPANAVPASSAVTVTVWMRELARTCSSSGTMTCVSAARAGSKKVPATACRNAIA